MKFIKNFTQRVKAWREASAERMRRIEHYGSYYHRCKNRAVGDTYTFNFPAPEKQSSSYGMFKPPYNFNRKFDSNPYSDNFIQTIATGRNDQQIGVWVGDTVKVGGFRGTNSQGEKIRGNITFKVVEIISVSDEEYCPWVTSETIPAFVCRLKAVDHDYSPEK